MKLLALFFCFCPIAVKAYIPPLTFIGARVAKSHGRAIYSVEQEVSITAGTDTVIVLERWIIDDGASMQLSIKGAPGRGVMVYQKGQRTWKDPEGPQRSEQNSTQFIEPFFHVRSYSGFIDQMAFAQIASKTQLIPQRKPQKGKEFAYVPEPYVRLGRTGGAIAYAIGQPSPVNAPQGFPGLWIEQDRFHIRKIRFPSGAEVTADDYAEFSYDLAFPRQRTISWEGKTARIQLLRIAALPKNTSIWQALAAKDSSFQLADSPMRATVQEFYKRFR